MYNKKIKRNNKKNKKSKQKHKHIDNLSQHVVIIIFALISPVLSMLCFRAQSIRAGDGLKDLGYSIMYYFCSLIGKEASVTVTGFPSLDILDYLPYDFDEIFRRLGDMWKSFFDFDCFKEYINGISEVLNIIVLLALPLMLLVLCGIMIFDSVVFAENTNHGKRSKPLKLFEDKPFRFLKACVKWVKELFCVFVSHWYYYVPICLVWLVNLNMAAVVLEVVAYYFYFAISQDVFNLVSVQIGKLLLDLFIMMSSAPIVFWLLVGYTILWFISRSIGFKILDRCEKSNRRFIDEQPLGFMACGSMGSKKTTFITDIVISKEIMLREKAYELLIEQDMKFPNFNWICLEDSLKRAMSLGIVCSLSTCRAWVRNRKRYYFLSPSAERLFNYDIDKYRVEFDDNLRINDIWDVIEDYAQLYFIYIIQSSLLVANYSIRVDNVLESKGNFESWNTELFRRKPEESMEVSRHAHILDYDTLRLGMSMVEKNPNRATFEFGVVVITEIGKERGNQFDKRGHKKTDDEINQINDLFVDWVKLFRHKATVCYYPFVCLVCDEQRPESLEANLRELFNIVYIRKTQPLEIKLPLYFLGEMVRDVVFNTFGKFYKKFRFNRGDITLFSYVLHNLAAKVDNSHLRNKNLFGVSKLDLEVERGTKDGDVEKFTYYLCEKKAHSDRFATDCFVLYFEDVLLSSKKGLLDYREYETIEPTAEEYDMQNSFLVQNMKKY